MTDNDGQTRRTSPRVKVGLIAGGTALVALLVGWLAGSATTACDVATGCQPNWPAAEAIGTWVGGLGTVGAVLWAAYTLGREEDARRRATDRALMSRIERDEADEDEANQVSVRAHANSFIGEDVVTGAYISVVNGADSESVFKLTGTSTAGPLIGAHKLEAGRSSDTHLQLPNEAVMKNQRQAWDTALSESVTIEFTMHGQRWRRVGSGPVERISK